MSGLEDQRYRSASKECDTKISRVEDTNKWAGAQVQPAAVAALSAPPRPV